MKKINSAFYTVLIAILLCLMISLSGVCLAFGTGGVEGGWVKNEVENSQNQNTSSSVSNIGTIPDRLRGGTVEILLDREATKSEKQRFSYLESNYGLKVNVKVTEREVYENSWAAMVAAGSSPDIAVLRTPYFIRIAKYFEPLNYFEHSDVIGVDRYDWNSDVSNIFKVNGNHFAVSGYESYNDYITLFYNESIFANMGLSSPEYYYQTGRWYFERFMNCVSMVEMQGITSFADDGNLLNYMLGAGGLDFVDYNNSKFSNNLSNVTSVCQAYGILQNYLKNNALDGDALENFKNGKTAMIALPYKAGYSDDVYGLWDSGLEIGSVPFPSQTVISSSYQPYDAYGFGIPTTAQAPEGAAYVLKNMFFGDYSNNENSSSSSSASSSSGSVELYNWNRVLNFTPKVSYIEGVLNCSDNMIYNDFIEALSETTPAQMNAVLEKYRNPINASISTANKILSVIKAKRKISVFTKDINYGKVSESLIDTIDDEEVTVNATAYDGCEFVGWYEENELVSTDSKYTFTVSKSCELEAKFTVAVLPKEKIVYNFENDQARVLTEELAAVEENIGRNNSKALHIYPSLILDGEYYSKITLGYADVLSINKDLKYDVFAWAKFNTNHGTGLNSRIYCDGNSDNASISKELALMTDDSGWHRIYLGTINTSGDKHKEINITFYKNENSFDDIYIDDIELVARTEENKFDMNCDEATDVKDLIRLKRYIAYPKDTIVIKQRCDIDGNNVIAAGDLVLLRKRLLNVQ